MDSCSDCVIDLLFNSPFINGFLLLEENDMSIFHMNIHIVQNYYEHVYQAVHFDSCQSPVALFPRWGGGVAPFPGSLTRGKKETGNVMADKPLTSAARNLAAPIRLRNDSCESMMKFATRPSLVPRLSLPL